MTWEEVCADPCLQDLPYKIELNKWGHIEMSPKKNYRGEFQGQIAIFLHSLKPNGVVMTECAIETSENIKVADVAWVSRERRRTTPHEIAYTVAPEICVEILSMSNSQEEMENKRRLYFEAGALECWQCDEQGRMAFFDAAGPLEKSRLCPEFPARIEIEP